jgi:hypothetical protein
MQAIHYPYTTNQSTIQHSRASGTPVKRQQSASDTRTRTGRTHKEGRTSSRADQGVTETRARRVSDISKEEAQQTAPQGANQQQKTQKWTAVYRISASYKEQVYGMQANRQRIARETTKRTLSVYSLEGVTAFKLFPLRRVFQFPKKGHSILYLYSSST